MKINPKMHKETIILMQHGMPGRINSFFAIAQWLKSKDKRCYEQSFSSISLVKTYKRILSLPIKILYDNKNNSVLSC